MNKENFKTLISEIETTGKFRFNMHAYISDLSQDDIDNFSYDFEFQTLSDLEKQGQFNNKFLASEYEPETSSSITTTNIFSCNTVACIAGYAMALSNDWKTPSWLNPNSVFFHRNQHSSELRSFSTRIENEANKFLGLTPEQGEKLYYNRGDSIWKFLRYYESERYPSLQWQWEKDYEDECGWGDVDKEILREENLERYRSCSWTDCELDIYFGSINYITAADVLTRILNEEIVIGSHYGEIKVNPPKTKEE